MLEFAKKVESELGERMSFKYVTYENYGHVPRAAAFYKKAGWEIVGIHGKGKIKFEMTYKDWTNKTANRLPLGKISENERKLKNTISPFDDCPRIKRKDAWTRSRHK